MSLTTRAAPRQKKRLEWTIVPELTPSASLADAIIQLKNSGSKKWKWAKSPGNGQSYSVFQCNAHVDCGHLRMAARLDGSYVIKECGTHGAEENLKKRKNSPLTFSEEEAVRSSITSGTRPASLGLVCASVHASWSDLVHPRKFLNIHEISDQGLNQDLRERMSRPLRPEEGLDLGAQRGFGRHRPPANTKEARRSAHAGRTVQKTRRAAEIVQIVQISQTHTYTMKRTR